MEIKSIENNNRKQDIKKWILIFSRADNKRFFSFTSGHLGALSFSDHALHAAISSREFYYTSKQIIFLFLELIKLVLISLFPVKNFLRILRTGLRRFCNPNFIALNSLLVLSLGDQPANHDPYFAKILSHKKESFDYLKIVGGIEFRTKNFFYIESGLNFIGFVLLVCAITFLPYTALWYAIRSSRKIQGFRARVFYLISCFREINSGVAVNNLIITQSIKYASTNSITKTIFFPMEGRNWEKIIVSASRNLRLESVGYIHCSLTPRHLSLTNIGFYKREETPSLIITPSEMIFEIILKVFPYVRVKKGYFLRGDESDIKDISSLSCNCLLFALTSNIKESIKIINSIKESGIHETHKVILRLNKNAITYKTISQYADNIGLTLFSSSRTLHPCICFFRSSSVAIDYLKLNVQPVYLRLDEIISNNVFDLRAEKLFQTLEVDKFFSVNLHKIIKSNRPINKGMNISRYYLDSDVSDAELLSLLD